MGARETSCAEGDADECFALARDPDLADDARRRDYLAAACGLNHGDACTRVGVDALRTGDLEQAKKSFESGCSFGSPLACTFLGEAYWHGKQGDVQLDKDPKKAKKYHERAWELVRGRCDDGDGNACAQVGSALLRGHTGFNEGSGIAVRPNEPKGREYLHRACLELQSALACEDLSRDPQVTDEALVQKYRAKACELGVGRLCD